MENLIPLGDLKWIGVDLDGCLAYAVWPETHVGEPILEMARAVRKATKMGYKIVIHTARSWEDYGKIEKWLKKHRIPYRAIVCGKLLVKYYVDDRNVYPEDFIKRVNEGKI